VTTRETVMAALFTTISASTVFATTTRRWQSWQDDPNATPPPLPLLVLYEMNENTDYKNSRGLPPTRVWEVRALVYGRIPQSQTPGVPDKTTAGATVLNPLIDAVETALAPADLTGGLQTLGGLVQDCRIEGVTTKVLGDVDPSGICGAVIPIRILVQ
jgi:hypothetical protein